MEEYLHKSRLSQHMDALGLHLLMLLGSLCFFILQWGVRLPALTAGFGLYGMLCITRHKTRERRLRKREKRLRARIGGELTLEKLLMAPPRAAQFEAALLLSRQYDLTLTRTSDHGVLCASEKGNVLSGFLQRHPAAPATGQEILIFQRAARDMGAERGILCLPCACDASAREQALSAPPVRLVSRDAFIALAGAHNPATDAQLVELGKRKRRRATAGAWRRHILDRRRGKRYALYGCLLLGMHLLTGLPYYWPPALLCLGLWTACRCVYQKEERS